ncbi:MAG: MFS transporter [Deltaproteobacteria bacterium]|nr:MFS transporter [Deltaproteobacteria bacterium]
MIYPLLPVFLVSLGAGGAYVGLVEGVAETTAAFLKLASGQVADRLPRKKGLVLLGYGLSSAARPLVSLALVPWHVLTIRFTDRVGKGIRSSPRDALIAQVTPADRLGKAYGFHRAMDHAGALVGPLVALALLGIGLGTRTVFALAAIPAAAAMLMIVFGVKEPRAPVLAERARVGGKAPLPPLIKRYLALVALFTLSSSSDAFLLLRAADLGVPVSLVPLLWALFHAVKSSLATPMGAQSDRLGRKRVIVTGWIVHALAYLGFAVAHAEWHAWALFVLYGAYYALTEGAQKALVADLAPEEQRGRSFGFFHFVVGICALPASLGFGLIWEGLGHGAAFGVASALALVAALGMGLGMPRGGVKTGS